MFKYHNIIENSTRLRAMTGLTVDAFMALVPLFHATFEAYMENHTIDGRERYSRSYVPYPNSPLPTSEDKLVFILTALKQNTTQEIQGQLFGMTQSNVSKWMKLLHTVLNLTLEQHNLLPARDAQTLARQLQHMPTDASNPAPFLSMMEPSDQ